MLSRGYVPKEYPPLPQWGTVGENSFRSTTDAVADTLIKWIKADAADGFILGFPVIAEGLDDFVRYAVPVLEERGVYRRDLPGQALRDHLGLPFRASRYAAHARAAE